MRRCTKCRALNRDTDRFCSLCQCALPAAEAAEPITTAVAVEPIEPIEPIEPVEPIATPLAPTEPARSGREILLDAGSKAFGGSPTLLTSGLEHLAALAVWRVDAPHP